MMYGNSRGATRRGDCITFDILGKDMGDRARAGHEFDVEVWDQEEAR